MKALMRYFGVGALLESIKRARSSAIFAEIMFAPDAGREDKLQQTRSSCLCLPLAEMIHTSKDLVEIDRLPDTQDEALTYTCCIDSE